MSAIPPKADISSALCDVRFVPEADIHQLFDYMVGAREWRNGARGRGKLGSGVTLWRLLTPPAASAKLPGA
jgi:hypothetical protein